MDVVLLHNQVSAAASADEADVLAQVEAVSESLERAGHAVKRLACTLDLSGTMQRLQHDRPDVVFNLVESLGGTDRLIVAATLVLDTLEIPYTGSRTAALFATVGKLGAKRTLIKAGLPTPSWLEAGDHAWHGERPQHAIIKTVWEHASFGIDDEAVVSVEDEARVAELLRARSARLGRTCFAEQYVEGREFNLSLLAAENGPRVLPAAEIEFLGFAPDKPRIVGYRAKWETSTAEYQQTPRKFDFALQDAKLFSHLAELARTCWDVFDLRGYARVDFRVDECGEPWILEVNANPCLSPDAGFAAAVVEAGMTYDAAIRAILADAVR